MVESHHSLQLSLLLPPHNKFDEVILKSTLKFYVLKHNSIFMYFRLLFIPH